MSHLFILKYTILTFWALLPKTAVLQVTTRDWKQGFNICRWWQTNARALLYRSMVNIYVGDVNRQVQVEVGGSIIIQIITVKWRNSQLSSWIHFWRNRWQSSYKSVTSFLQDCWAKNITAPWPLSLSKGSVFSRITAISRTATCSSAKAARRNHSCCPLWIQFTLRRTDVSMWRCKGNPPPTRTSTCCLIPTGT